MNLEADLYLIERRVRLLRAEGESRVAEQVWSAFFDPMRSHERSVACNRCEYRNGTMYKAVSRLMPRHDHMSGDALLKCE